MVLAIVCERDGYHLRVTSRGITGMRYDSWAFYTAAEVIGAVQGILGGKR